mgnify:CR=1 FL=1
MITCIHSNKRYIGQARCYINPAKGKPIRHGTDSRWKQHIYAAKSNPRRGCVALYNAICKYGADGFTVKTIYICDEKCLNYYESKFIRQYNTLTPNGYNLKAGGACCRWSDAVKSKISATKKGRPKPTGYGTMMRDLKKGIKSENDMLPEFLYHYKDVSRGIEGYRVLRHPILPDKVFVAKSLSMEEKLRLAKLYLETSDKFTSENRIIHKRVCVETQNLPKYVYYRKSKFEGRCGYIVKYPNIPCKVFVSVKHSMDEKRSKAIEYLKSITQNRERFID